MQSQAPQNAGKLHDVNFEKLIQSGHTTLRVTGLQKDGRANDRSTVLDLCLRADAGKDDIMHAIKDAGAHITSICRDVLMLNLATLGFTVPYKLTEERELRISVTEGDSVYDAAVPGGLRVNRYIIDVLSIFSFREETL